jgi:hypothetical protein
VFAHPVRHNLASEFPATQASLYSI